MGTQIKHVRSRLLAACPVLSELNVSWISLLISLTAPCSIEALHVCFVLSRWEARGTLHVTRMPKERASLMDHGADVYRTFLIFNISDVGSLHF